MGNPGRPRSQTVPYFSHDCKREEGNTLDVLETKYGDKGYVFFHKLLETLGNAPGHYLDVSKSKTLNKLLTKCKIEQELCFEMLDLMVELEDLDKQLWEEHRVIWYQNFVDRLEVVYKKRAQELPLKPSFCHGNPSTPDVSETETLSKGDGNSTSKVSKVKKEKKSKEGPEDSDPASLYFLLAQRIIKSAAELDAKGVGLNKDTPSQRERRILEAAEDIRKLIEVSWVRWDSVKAIKFANQIWDWVLKQYETSDGKGFTWRRNIRSGYKFRYHLDSQLKHRGKEGGELLRQYRASLEYQEIQRRAVAQKQKAKQKPEESTEPQRDEEAELKEILAEQGEKAWAVAYFEMLKITPEEARTNPILSEVPRTQEALKILGLTTKEKKI